MRKIDIEAHFLTEEYVEYLYARKDFPRLEDTEDEKHQKISRLWYGPDLYWTRGPGSRDRLLDVGEGRLREMDDAGIAVQALSLADPGCEPLEAAEGTEMARKTNDELARAVAKYPDRFTGLAALAPQDPGGAADELERAVKELGFRGVKINSNIRGEYLDDPKYWVIFERAEKLGVPIFLHPMVPAPDMLKPYLAYGGSLTGPSLGFAAETSLHAMRLIYDGVFDRYPGVKIILGHLGEALPFWMHRLNLGCLETLFPGEDRPKCQRKPSEYLKTNFLMTTSGMFFTPAFLCVYLALGADNMAFAVDHPYAPNKPAVKFMEEAPICDGDKEKICHLNAERLLKLRT